MKFKKEYDVYDHRIEQFAVALWYIQHPKSRLRHPFKDRKRAFIYKKMAVEIIRRMINTLFNPVVMGELLKMYYSPDYLTNLLYKEEKAFKGLAGSKKKRR